MHMLSQGITCFSFKTQTDEVKAVDGLCGYVTADGSTELRVVFTLTIVSAFLFTLNRTAIEEQ